MVSMYISFYKHKDERLTHDHGDVRATSIRSLKYL